MDVSSTTNGTFPKERFQQVLRLPPRKALRKLAQLLSKHPLETVEPLLPLLFRLRGEPYTLKEHFHFGPMFRTRLPHTLVWQTARQVGKTQSLAAQACVLALLRAHMRMLYVAPLYEQIRRFSTLYIRPLIEESPLRPLWVAHRDSQSVLQRTFRNGSIMLFSHAFLDATRVRGISSDLLGIDEIQSMDPDHLPVLNEVIALSPLAINICTGTPLTDSSALALKFSRSSQAEWVIKCEHCNYYNIPSAEHHIEKMIGPFREDISPEKPGIICARCKRPISPRPPHGRWVHRYSDRRWFSSGYHVPQIILPFHCENPAKWMVLLNKRDTYPPEQFFNEVLGEPAGTGKFLLSERELQDAGTLPWENNPNDPDPEIFKHLGEYRAIAMGVDWGGYGEEEVSYTAVAVVGIHNSNQLHVLWGKRFLQASSHLEDIREIIHWAHRFRVNYIAHDYSGANTIREAVLVNAGFPPERLMPIAYGRATKSDFIQYVPPSRINPQGYFRVDKPRSLLYTIHGLKLGIIRTFKYDGTEGRGGLMTDFLSLFEEKVDTHLAGPVYRICRQKGMSDDFAHAVNFAATALWYQTDSFPDLASAASVARISAELAAAAGPTVDPFQDIDGPETGGDWVFGI